MGKNRVDILIVGANASQGVYGDILLDDSFLPKGAETHVTFYDRRKIDPRPGLNHLAKGIRQGRVIFTETFPSKQRFDVVIIAVSTEQHVPALHRVLDELHEMPSLLVLEKPLGVSTKDLQWYRSVSAQLQPLTVVNEPFLIMKSVAELLRMSRRKPVGEVNIWSSKRRGTAKDHGGLKIFGVEFPHLHGVASLLAGKVLDVSDCQENKYYRDVEGRADNDGNTARFVVNRRLFTVSQGLGAFTMDRYGGMWANNSPQRTRKIRLTYTDGTYVELDIEPAFPGYGSHAAGVGKLYFYGVDGRCQGTKNIPDDPRRFFTKYIVQRALQPETPILPEIGLKEALARNAALLRLRADALILEGRFQRCSSERAGLSGG